jgi:hypothetical protein
MKEELSLLVQLIKLAEIDEKLREKEYDFLLQCAKLLKVDRKDFDELFAGNIEFTLPKMETERILQFYRLVLLANIDLEVSTDEMAFLRNAGFKLGLNPDAVEAIFIEMKKHETGMIPTERLIEIFKTYHN